MAFPTTGILDSGVGANAEPIGGNWSEPLFLGEGTLRRTTNRIAPASAGSGNGWWNPAEYGPDCEVYCEIGVMPTTGNFIQLFSRLQSEGGANPPGPDAYMCRLVGNDAGNETVRLYERVGGVASALGADMTSDAFVVGDAIGMEVIGTTISAYRRSGGVWALLGSRTNSSISAAGPVGLELVQTSLRVVNFGGGTVVTDTTALPPITALGAIGF